MTINLLCDTTYNIQPAGRVLDEAFTTSPVAE